MSAGTFAHLSKLADNHTFGSPHASSGPDAVSHHEIGAALHDAAAKVGMASRVPPGQVNQIGFLVDHHNNLAQVHSNHAKFHAGKGVLKAEWESPVKQKELNAKAAKERLKNPEVTEGPHAKGKGSFLGVPVDYKSYSK
jgi:hypothetical protein